ncbi:hypothetical protein GW813_11805 [bacterium]|nr:hypothetical protein [bacterium]
MAKSRPTLALCALVLLVAGGAQAQVTPAESLDAALTAAQANNQLVIVDFYADW